jgi:hypothetical protein
MCEGNRQREDPTTWRHRRWTFSGYGEWDGGKVDVGTGETLLDRARRRSGAGEDPTISLRAKGREVQRESEQGVVLEGGDSITPPSPERNREQGKALCLSRAW